MMKEEVLQRWAEKSLYGNKMATQTG